MPEVVVDLPQEVIDELDHQAQLLMLTRRKWARALLLLAIRAKQQEEGTPLETRP